VLLVEDEAPLLAGTAEVLSELGYEPVAFSGQPRRLVLHEQHTLAVASWRRPAISFEEASATSAAPGRS